MLHIALRGRKGGKLLLSCSVSSCLPEADLFQQPIDKLQLGGRRGVESLFFFFFTKNVFIYFYRYANTLFLQYRTYTI